MIMREHKFVCERCGETKTCRIIGCQGDCATICGLCARAPKKRSALGLILIPLLGLLAGCSSQWELRIVERVRMSGVTVSMSAGRVLTRRLNLAQCEAIKGEMIVRFGPKTITADPLLVANKVFEHTFECLKFGTLPGSEPV